MQVVERSARVAYSPAQMLALVNDVARYPQFLPWCTGARVDPVSAGETLAALDVAKGPVRMQFTTRNTARPGEQILMQLEQGPFSRLDGQWNFDAVGDRGSRVLFKVEFEFRSRLMSVALGPVFQSVCDSIVDAFVQRALRIYG